MNSKIDEKKKKKTLEILDYLQARIPKSVTAEDGLLEDIDEDDEELLFARADEFK